MKVPARHWLPIAWAAAFTCWLVGGSSPAIGWVLRILTLALVGAICVRATTFVWSRVEARKGGEQVWTETTLRGLLLGTLVVGVVLRVVGWSPGHAGVVTWIGGTMMLVSFAGLLLLQFIVERARARNPSFYFNPNWKYGLVLLFIVSLTIQGLVRPHGVMGGLNVTVFWLSLILLLVQTVGRWISRWRGKGSGATTQGRV